MPKLELEVFDLLYRRYTNIIEDRCKYGSMHFFPEDEIKAFEELCEHIRNNYNVLMFQTENYPYKKELINEYVENCKKRSKQCHMH